MSSPLNILMISDVYFPRVNGVSTSIRTCRRELIAQGHRVTLIAPAYPGVTDGDDPHIIRIASWQVPRDPEDRMMRRKFIDQLLPSLLTNRYDVLHIHTPFIAHYAGLWLAKHLSIPVVETYHTFFEEYLHHYVPFMPRNLLRLLARRFTISQCNAVNRLIAPSRAMQSALINYGVRTRTEVLPTGLEQNQFKLGDGMRFRRQHGIAPERPTLLYVGRIAHEKNIDFLLHVFANVVALLPNALLLIVGEGPALPHLHELVKQLGLAAAVRFIGNLERDTELLDCYRAGDLFLFASRTETQGLVLLEALAQGTPVVSTAHMGTRDVLEGTQGARIVEDDPAQFAGAVVELLQNQALRARMAVLAPADAQKWSSQEMAERLTRLYVGAIETNQASVKSPPTVAPSTL